MRAPRLAGLLARRSAALMAIVITGACAEYSPTSPAPRRPAAPDQGATAWLNVSGSAFRAGNRVTVQLNAVCARTVSAIGSFTFAVSYDTTGLRFISAEGAAGGMMAAHAAAGRVALAGASASGFTDVTLGTITMEVVNPAAIESLVLHVSELNTVGFADQAARTMVERQVFHLPDAN